MATDPAVQAWITKHSSDIYETDLWFVVKEGGKEIRVPACRAVLKLTCALVRDLPEAGDVPVLGAHTAATVVKVVQACYPFWKLALIFSRLARGRARAVRETCEAHVPVLLGI